MQLVVLNSLLDSCFQICRVDSIAIEVDLLMILALALPWNFQLHVRYATPSCFLHFLFQRNTPSLRKFSLFRIHAVWGCDLQWMWLQLIYILYHAWIVDRVVNELHGKESSSSFQILNLRRRKFNGQHVNIAMTWKNSRGEFKMSEHNSGQPTMGIPQHRHKRWKGGTHWLWGPLVNLVVLTAPDVYRKCVMANTMGQKLLYVKL